MQKISPFLWFDTQAEEAAKFYTSIFKNSKIGSMSRYDEVGAKASGRASGSVMTVAFQLDGQDFTAINGGPVFPFTEAISFVVNCESQEEVDHHWNALTQGGQEVQCGWLIDKYGVSWQVVPSCLPPMLENTSSLGAKRAMEAFMKMKKFDIAALKEAYYGE